MSSFRYEIVEDFEQRFVVRQREGEKWVWVATFKMFSDAFRYARERWPDTTATPSSTRDEGDKV